MNQDYNHKPLRIYGSQKMTSYAFNTAQNTGVEDRSNNRNIFCNNCRKYGHQFSKCKSPITSYGVILFRKMGERIEYLLIRRKHTLGFIDFMRGKYSVSNRYYIMNMLKQMTQEERGNLTAKTFDELWAKVWNDEFSWTADTPSIYNNQHKMEENISRNKFNQLCRGITVTYNKTGVCQRHVYTLEQLIDEANKLYGNWTEPEWGFPKGRRNYQENEFECAMREFSEETGVCCGDNFKLVGNLFPLEEIFMGSNYRSYRHKYFLTCQTEPTPQVNTQFVCSEVSKIAWKTLDETLDILRPYNTEKRELIKRVDTAIRRFYLA